MVVDDENARGCTCPDPFPIVSFTEITRSTAAADVAHWPTCALLAGHHCNPQENHP